MLCNVVRKPIEVIFREFAGTEQERDVAAGAETASPVCRRFIRECLDSSSISKVSRFQSLYPMWGRRSVFWKSH